MALLGDVGKFINAGGGIFLGARTNSSDGRLIANTVTLTGATAGDRILLSSVNGGALAEAVANASGEVLFYDVGPGTYSATRTTAPVDASDIMQWSVTVSATGVPTVAGPFTGGSGGTPVAGVQYFDPADNTLKVASSVDIPSGVSVIVVT